MATTIYDKILAKGELEVKEILEKAKLEAEKIESETINKAKTISDRQITKAKSDANKLINHQQRLVDLEERQALLLSKQRVIDEIFSEVLNKINNFKDKELLNFVSKLIKEQKVNGDEVIYVNKEDYDRYLKALSTNDKKDLVDLDKLNKNLKTNFKLSSESVSIKNGFLLEGKDFDLNFSYTNLVNKLRVKNEQKIAKELFD